MSVPPTDQESLFVYFVVDVEHNIPVGVRTRDICADTSVCVCVCMPSMTFS